MNSLFSPPRVEELDAETEAICAEVCEALEWYDPQVPGSTEYLRERRFGEKWWTAWWRGSCRKQIEDTLESLARADRSIFISQGGTCPTRRGGMIFPREQIRECGGRSGFLPADPETGELGRELIEWPTGRTVGGSWSYEKVEAA